MYQVQEKLTGNPGAVEEYEKLGSLLVKTGKLKQQDTAKVRKFQEKKSLLFGEAAVKLKLVSKGDIEQALATQFAFPYINANKYRFGPDLVMAYSPFDKEANAIRAIRTQLLFQWDKMDYPVMSLVSPVSGDGKSYISANLAVAFAQIGKKVLLIDANLHSPRQHEIFNVSDRFGLSSILTDGSINKLAYEIEGIENLSLLPAGPIPPHPLELFSSGNFHHALEKYKAHFDMILVDTPNLMEGSETNIISSMSHHAIIVARKDQTRFDGIIDLKHNLDSIDVKTVGMILNQV